MGTRGWGQDRSSSSRRRRHRARAHRRPSLDRRQGAASPSTHPRGRSWQSLFSRPEIRRLPGDDRIRRRAPLARKSVAQASRASSFPSPSSRYRSSQPPTCVSPMKICGTVPVPRTARPSRPARQRRPKSRSRRSPPPCGRAGPCAGAVAAPALRIDGDGGHDRLPDGLFAPAIHPARAKGRPEPGGRMHAAGMPPGSGRGGPHPSSPLATGARQGFQSARSSRSDLPRADRYAR